MTYKKILLIQTAFLGDAILTTPLVRALRQTFPDSMIDIMVIPETAAVFKNNPNINNIIIYNKRKLVWKWLDLFSLLINIKSNKYDLAVSAQLSMRTSLIMWMSGIPNRLGFPRQKLKTMTINLPKGLPVVKRYIKLMEALTNESFTYQTEVFWDEKTENAVNDLAGRYLKTNKHTVGIAPGSVWATKRWLPQYFSELIRLLAERNIHSVLIGGKEDYILCDEIAAESGLKPLNTAGKLTIQGSAAFIKRLNLIVTNDSAPLHLANAVQTDVVAIFGPTIRRFGFFPFRQNDKVLEIGLKCRPCGKHGGKRCPLKHFSCMKSITPDMVFKSVLETLEMP